MIQFHEVSAKYSNSEVCLLAFERFTECNVVRVTVSVASHVRIHAVSELAFTDDDLAVCADFSDDQWEDDSLSSVHDTLLFK